MIKYWIFKTGIEILQEKISYSILVLLHLFRNQILKKNPNQQTKDTATTTNPKDMH